MKAPLEMLPTRPNNGGRGKKARVVVVAFVAVVLGGLVWQFMRTSEPVYQGKSLQEYLDQLAARYPPKSGDDPALRAIHAMGTKAIPYLRNAYRKRNSGYVKFLLFVRAKLPKRIAARLPDPRPEYLQNLNGAATHALATFGPDAREALPDLIHGLTDRNSANMAIYALLQIGPHAKHLPAFLSMLNSSNDTAALYATDCISRIGLATPEVLTALIQETRSQAVYRRTRAIDALGELGPSALPAADVLQRNVSDPDQRVRIASVGALWRIHGKTNAPVAWLLQALEDELKGGGSRPAAPNTFGEHEFNLLLLTALLKEVGKEAQSAISALRAVRDQKDARLRLNAAEALWRIGGETNGVATACLEALAHSDPNVRLYGARLVSEFCIQERLALAELETMLTSNDSFTRFYAARALWKLKAQTDATLPALAAALEDHFTYYENAKIRQLAAETLGEFGVAARPAIPALLNALKDGVAQVRVAATNALKNIAPEAKTTK